jgi:hypothetical protein
MMGHKGSPTDGTSKLRRETGSPLEGTLSPGDVREVGQNCEGAGRYKGKPEQLIHHTPRATPT